MRLVPVSYRSSGLFAEVDDWTYDLASQYTWYALRVPNSDLVYACRQWDANGSHHAQLMHSLITGWPYVDHRDHNGLNCQMYNLRQADNQRNMMNMRKPRGGTSRFKGVSRQRGKWRASIGMDLHKCYLGYFEIEEDAARAYDAKALELFGEFACTNEMLGLYEE